MPVNDESAGKFRRGVLVGLGMSWTALAMTLAGGALALRGSFDASIGGTLVLVRYGDAYLPGYAVRIGAASYFIFAVALWRLILFLRLAMDGQVFVAEATIHLRAFGRWLLVAAAAATLLPPFSVVLNWLVSAHDAAQVPSIQVPLTTGLFVLAIATLIMMICGVIDEGRRVRDELDGIV